MQKKKPKKIIKDKFNQNDNSIWNFLISQSDDENDEMDNDLSKKNMDLIQKNQDKFKDFSQ